MKNQLLYLMIFVLLIPSLKVSAQSNQTKLTPDKRLQEVFSKQELNDMQTNKPESIVLYNYLIENAYYISDKAEGPIENIKYVTLRKDFAIYFNEDVNAISPKTFNYLKYNFKIDNLHYISYSLGNGKYLVFYPQSVTTTKFNSNKTK